MDELYIFVIIFGKSDFGYLMLNLADKDFTLTAYSQHYHFLKVVIYHCNLVKKCGFGGINKERPANPRGGVLESRRTSNVRMTGKGDSDISDVRKIEKILCTYICTGKGKAQESLFYLETEISRLETDTSIPNINHPIECGISFPTMYKKCCRMHFS